MPQVHYNAICSKICMQNIEQELHVINSNEIKIYDAVKFSNYYSPKIMVRELTHIEKMKYYRKLSLMGK